ncbi:MAG TPA: hypothetical protein VGH10_09940 [Actinomycetota bacterium]|jgi:hypothetical protein
MSLTLAAVACAALLSSACTSGGTTAGTHASTSPRVHGRLLISSSSGNDVAVVNLPTVRAIPMQRPVGTTYLAALQWGPDGTPWEFTPLSNVGSPALFSLSTTRPAQRLAPPIRGDFFQIAGGRLMAAACGGFVTVAGLRELSSPSTWQRLPTGASRSCGAALSPDGRRVAYPTLTGTGDRIVELPADGAGAPRELVSLGDLDALAAAGIRRPVVGSNIVWGRGGIAFLAKPRSVLNGQANQAPHALVVIPPAGAPLVVALGKVDSGEVLWQPRGDLVAFTDDVGFGNFGRTGSTAYTELRVFDPRSQTMRQIGTASGYASGLFAWASDGSAIAWGQTNDFIRFLTPSGGSLGALPIEGVPFDWAT